MKGIHLRYLGEDVRSVDGVGVFQRGTVAFVPQELAIELLKSGEFRALSDGPTAQVFIVRIGQESFSSPQSRSVEPDSPADFELELEEEERRLTKKD